MTNEEAIKLLSKIMRAILPSNSLLPSTDNPIKECFGMAIKALEVMDGIPHFDYCEGLEKGYKKGRQEGYTEGYNSAVHDYQIGATYDPDTDTYWDVRKGMYGN